MNGYVITTKPSNGFTNIFDVLASSRNYKFTWVRVTESISHFRAKVREHFRGNLSITSVDLSIMNAGDALLRIISCGKSLTSTEDAAIPQLTLFPSRRIMNAFVLQFESAVR